MSDTPNTKENEQKIEGDRDIPSVAQNKDYSKIGIAIFIALGMIAIIAVALDGLNKNKPARLTAPEETLFKTASTSASGPYIEEPQAEILEEPEIKEAQNPQISALEIQMQQEAIRRAQEAELETKKRIASPQIVFDKKSAIPFATSEQVVAQNGALSGGAFTGGDPNLAFARDIGNSGVDTAQARQLNNLHALIAQGTMISGILETAIQSDLPGMVRAITNENTYSFDGTNLLIPKGSRLIGRYNSALVRGQSRVFIIWSRLIRPDGVSINIGSYGTDDLGRAGLGGQVDTKFFERFGSSVLLSLIDAGISAGVNALDTEKSANIALNTGGDFSSAAEIALENTIGIKPTIHIHQGAEIKVFVGKDLDFSNSGNLPKTGL